MKDRQARLVAALVLWASVLAGRAGAEGTPRASFRIAQRSVTEAEYQAFRARLTGQVSYRCKKMAFGGIVSYLAKDPEGRWYRITQVFDRSTRSSRIEPAEAPKRQ